MAEVKEAELNGAEVEGSISDKLCEVHCSCCGRFIGYVRVIDGLFLVKCKNCKQWVIIAEGPVHGNLTTQQIYDMVRRS